MCPWLISARLPTKSAAFIEVFNNDCSHCLESSALLSGGRYLGAMRDLSDPVGNSGSQRERVKMDKKVRELASAQCLPVSSGLSESHYCRDGILTTRIVTAQSAWWSSTRASPTKCFPVRIQLIGI